MRKLDGLDFVAGILVAACLAYGCAQGYQWGKHSADRWYTQHAPPTCPPFVDGQGHSWVCVGKNEWRPKP